MLNKSAFEMNKKPKESDFMKSRWHANKKREELWKNKQQSKCKKNVLRLRGNKKKHDTWQHKKKLIGKSSKDRMRFNA